MTWQEILAPVLQSHKMQEIKKFLQAERKVKNIYPAGKEVFRAFDLCPYEKTKVVIVGQDPYHSEGTADGLAFSSQQKKTPPSLQVIFNEIYKDLNIQYLRNVTLEEFFPTNDLKGWTELGFLMINATLTVEQDKPNSHRDLGWDMVVKKVFEGLNKKKHQVIFLLWGKEAQKYASLIDPDTKHIHFDAAHPAAELYGKDAGFYGCRHFSIVRDVLPAIEGKNIFPTIDLDLCFDKEKAKDIIRKHYPLESDQICEYIDKEMMIHIPVNSDTYWKEIRNFENLISTNYSNS